MCWRRLAFGGAEHGLSSQPLGAMKFGQQSEQAFKEYASLGLPPFPYKKLKKALKHADARNSDPQSQQSIDLRNLERERVQDEKARKDRTLQHLRDAKDGRYKLTTGPEELEQQRHAIDERKRKLVAAMQELSTNYPDIAPELQDLMNAV